MGFEGVTNEKRVLLVDDDPAVRAIPALLLRKWGYQVVEASDGQQALDVLSGERISMVISDWVMPNVTGIDLCRRIRERNSEHYTYLILCTSKGEKSDLIEGLEAGADDFLVKPISKEEMRVRVRAGERVLELERGLAERNCELRGINAQLKTAYECIESDLRAAAWMQANLLPSPSLKAKNIISGWRFQPSSYVAGDIFNIFPLDERQMGFYLLDVSGHGVPAAMLSVTLSMVLSPEAPGPNPLKRYNAAAGAFEAAPPEEVVNDLNQRFQSKDDRYFTMVYGVIDHRTGDLAITQAGHPNPVLIRGGELRLLGEGGAPVGLWPDMEFDTIRERLLPGDRLVLYSDGVIECAGLQGELFGESRLNECLSRSASQPLDHMLAEVESAMEQWHGSREYEDDVSLLALEFSGGSLTSATKEIS